MGETQKKEKKENRTYNEDFYCIACRSDIWNYFMLCGSKWTYQRRHYRRRCTVRGRTRLYQTDEDVGCTTGILFACVRKYVDRGYEEAWYSRCKNTDLLSGNNSTCGYRSIVCRKPDQSGCGTGHEHDQDQCSICRNYEGYFIDRHVVKYYPG